MENSIEENSVDSRMSYGRMKYLLKKHALFICTVLIPLMISCIYFGLVASDVYVSEAKFIVSSPEKQTVSGIGAILKGAGFSSSEIEEVYAVREYAQSRDALRALNKNGQFYRSYSDTAIDIFNRFGFIGNDSFEDLFKYYKSKIKVENDSSSSVTTLTTRAYNAEDAYKYNERLLELSESLVNRLNERGRQDLIRFAKTELNDAKLRAQEASVALAVFRNAKGVVDPERQAPIQLQLISKLQDDLIATRAQLAQIQSDAPENPQLGSLKVRVASLEQQIADEEGKVTGGGTSLAGTAAQYQRLALESQFADRQLASAMTAFEQARNDARRKQVYLERIVQPNRPDAATEPRRLRGIFATLILGLVAWGILTMLLAGVREHQG